MNEETIYLTKEGYELMHQELEKVEKTLYEESCEFLINRDHVFNGLSFCLMEVNHEIAKEQRIGCSLKV